MKLSKSIISAMAVGLSIGAISSCSKDEADLHNASCDKNCKIDHASPVPESEEDFYYCPPCGRG